LENEHHGLLERDIVSQEQEFVEDGAMILNVGMVVVVARE
jgi:hypothetical protein